MHKNCAAKTQENFCTRKRKVKLAPAPLNTTGESLAQRAWLLVNESPASLFLNHMISCESPRGKPSRSNIQVRKPAALQRGTQTSHCDTNSEWRRNSRRSQKFFVCIDLSRRLRGTDCEGSAFFTTGANDFYPVGKDGDR